MRAEDMTVGLELCNLENLRIFNGYEVLKKERKLSNPSSPEDSNGEGKDGDQDSKSRSKGHHSPRQRCGRPSNPIPRHKRDSHIRAEYKRRDKIQKGFETLRSLVPELRNTSSSKESKSSILFKTAEYSRGLRAEFGQSQNEAAALRQELEALGSEIHNLQEKLPDHGFKEKVEPIKDLDMLYDEYVKEETNKNWKFWIFSFFMRPLYKSYRSMMSGKMNQFEFAQATNEWVTDTMSLASLRKGFLDTFRKFSTQTSILTDPSKLEAEAYEAVNKTHRNQKPVIKESPPSPSPEIPRFTTSPGPYSPVPGLIPVTAGMVSEVNRTSPSLGASASKGKQPMSPPTTTEVPKSSRSRSSTPPPAVLKQRRRSRSRSETNRTKNVEKTQPMEVTESYATVVTNSTSILRMMLDNKKQPEASASPFIVAGSNNTPIRDSPLEVDAFLNPPHSSTFLPIDTSVSIANGQIIHENQQDNNIESQSLITDLSFAMDTTLSQPSESFDLDNLSVFTTAQPTVISHHSPLLASHIPLSSNSDHPKSLKQERVNVEEDSLTGMLNIDLLDVNSIMTFLDQDHLPPTSSHNHSISSS